MDNHFNPNYMSYGQPSSHQQQQNLGSFGNLSAGGHQPHDSHAHPTLPPLQSQNGAYSFGGMYNPQPGSQAHTPTTPHTPATSSMNHNPPNAFSHISPAQTPVGSMMPPAYPPQYAMSSSAMYPSSTATAMPPSSASINLPNIRPMPPGGVGSMSNGLPSLANTGALGQNPSFAQSEETPTHVVGSQGRRGVLPSAPGRPNPPAAGTNAAAKSMIPQKDADGKFPCPHCNKTYLHAKHLKRHLLRHTGDRPYMCHLCKDTFSRSDILKRHFQKCSIRRGNPTGANHLAHQRRATNGSNRLSVSESNGTIGLAGLQEVAGSAYNPAGSLTASPTTVGEISGRSSRANSLIQPGALSHRNSLAGLGILGSNGPGQDGMASSAAYQSGLPAYAMQNTQLGGQQMANGYSFNNNQQHHMNGLYGQHPQQPPQHQSQHQPQHQMSFLGQASSRMDREHIDSPHSTTPTRDNSNGNTDWTRVFSQAGQDGFLGSHPANANSQAIKTEGDHNNDQKPVFNLQNDQSFLGSLYSLGNPSEYGDKYEQGIPGFPNWSVDDPLKAKVDSLMQYCFPNGLDSTQGHHTADIVRMCLSVDNVKHFAEHFTSWHGHWPLIHMPTFKLTEANNALVLAMICIGAVYSPKLSVAQVRCMMEFAQSTIYSRCTIYQRTIRGLTQGLGNNNEDVEELQALIMLQSLFMWHGNPQQREKARNGFPVLIQIAKCMDLCDVARPGHYAYSVLHNTPSGQMPDASVWSWNAWLQQEKRSRALYLLFLCDAALAIYFNSVPQLDPLEIRLPLPADDAAWDASKQHECASALGLNGPAAQAINTAGTRKASQPSMREALRDLMEPMVQVSPGSTNSYSKFVLIHALIVRIIACQKLILQPSSELSGFSMHLEGTPATPVSQGEWQTNGGSNANSGTSTPAEPSMHFMQAHQERKRLGHALDTWKLVWDADISLQYPDPEVAQKRSGFSRDGVPFFFLGRSFLSSQNPREWTALPDLRFTQVMSLLKRIKQFVSQAGNGVQDIGSVGKIDDQYGLNDLTLDMKLLFKPQ